jgi:hypothetical protein
MTTEGLMKLALGVVLTDQDIEDELFKICNRIHSSCDRQCPVYALNNGHPLGFEKDWLSNCGCDCFKNGKAMLAFMRKFPV